MKVTERKFVSIAGGAKNRVAALRQKFFLIVREPTKHYGGAGQPLDGRDFPFTDVEVLTRVTPSLLAPDTPACRLDQAVYDFGVPHRACFWPMIGSKNDFRFQLAATDLGGNRVTFAMPLLFVGVEANENPAAIAEIISEYNAEPIDPRRRAPLGGASVCYAPKKDGAEGDPRLPTGEMVFRAAEGGGEPDFYPAVESARVGIAAIQRLLQKPDATVGVRYAETYKTSGFGAGNAGELFLQLEEPFSLEFGEQVKSDALGGLASPSMAILGLSRIMGPVSATPPADPKDIGTALVDIAGNKFNPADFFQRAKIFSAASTSERSSVSPSLAGADVPKLLSRQSAASIDATFDWSTRVTKRILSASSYRMPVVARRGSKCTDS